MTMGISVAGSILGVVFTNKAYSFVLIPDKSLLCLFPMIQIPMIYGKTFSSDDYQMALIWLKTKYVLATLYFLSF